MNKKKKRGFTLVELLVVIAILAVLATVAILGYSSFIKKANISNDRAIITQMNNALLASEVFDEIPNYCDEAVDIAIDAGFILENLTPSTSGYNYAYDLGRNRFILLDEEFVYVFGDDNHSTDKIKIQIVVRNDEELQQANTNGYSTYLREKFEFKDDTKTITTSKGIDVGKNVEVAVIKYTNSSEGQNVVIRTNGGSLIVNSKVGATKEESDEITHYGLANTIDIQKTAQFSYYEKGAVAMLSVKEGHIVITDDSDVFGVHFEKSGTKDAQNADTFNDIKLTFESNVDFEQIEFSRDAVAINTANGTKVCEVELNQDNQFIYLFQQGIYEQIKVAPVSNESNKTWVTDAPVSDDTKELSFQIANNLFGRSKFEEVSTITPTYSDSTNRVLADTTKAVESGTTLNSALSEVKKAFEKKYAPDVDVIDVVFVIDDSSSTKVGTNFETKVTDALNTIVSRFSSEKTINVGIVKFKGYAISALQDEQGKDIMISYSSDKAEDIENAIKVACPGNGSNLQSGIIKGQELLEASSTPDKCKFMVLFTDCKTYYWLNDNGEATTIYGYYSSQRQFNGVRSASGLTNDALLPQVSQTAGIDKYNSYAIENSNGTPLRFGGELNQDFIALFNSTNLELINSTKYDTVADWSRKYGNPTGSVSVKSITNPIRSGYANLNEDYTYTKYMDYSINQTMNVLELNPYEVIDNGDDTVTFDLTKNNPDYYAYHVCSWEKGLYKAAHAFADVNKKYNCSVVGYVKEVTGWGQFQQGFASWLEENADAYCNVASNGESEFNSLLNNLVLQIFDLAKIDYEE